MWNSSITFAFFFFVFRIVFSWIYLRRNILVSYRKTMQAIEYFNGLSMKLKKDGKSTTEKGIKK
jgi:hypothetical protein